MKLIKGVQDEAIKLLAYGPEGIGKSTFASRFPLPVFIDTEGSTARMDVVRTPAPTSWAAVTEQVKYFIQHPDKLSTLIIDTADWAEKLCIEQICATKQIKSIEDVGYGRGYVYLAEEFGRFLNLLDELRSKYVHIVLTAHASMRKFEQPDELGAYDRWELKLQKKTAPMVKEWADAIFFINYKTYVVNVDGQGTTKGKNKAQGGSRVMYTTHHPCWDAKNRFNLPGELPFSFSEIAHIFPVAGIPVSAAPEPVPNRQSEPTPVSESQHDTPITATDMPQTTETVEDEDDPLTGIDSALAGLMRMHDVSVFEIQQVVGSRGHFPVDTPIANYPDDYVKGVLIAAWDKVHESIRKLREELPF